MVGALDRADFCRLQRFPDRESLSVPARSKVLFKFPAKEASDDGSSDPDIRTEARNSQTGRITSNSTALLRTEVRGLIPGAKRIVLDLTDVTYMDSSGLGALVGLYVSARGQNCELKVIHLNQRLQELFRLTKLASVFEGRDDLPWG